MGFYTLHVEDKENKITRFISASITNMPGDCGAYVINRIYGDAGEARKRKDLCNGFLYKISQALYFPDYKFFPRIITTAKVGLAHDSGINTYQFLDEIEATVGDEYPGKYSAGRPPSTAYNMAVGDFPTIVIPEDELTSKWEGEFFRELTFTGM